ncbi:hypothetical protein N7451_005548 [Penicillium sp. IBT 35674x]|nr:hypothetical protein N7451_005548 [Penicillium sp. IBT 35674x]
MGYDQPARQKWECAEARDCETVASVDGNVPTTLELHTPEQLDSFEGCTTLNGHIVIQSDYEGDFILNDVTEFNGNISTAEDSPKALNRFEMGVLETVQNIHLLGLSGNFSLPKLAVAGDVELVQVSDSGAVDLRSLSEANSLSIRGSWTSTDLSLLKTVTVSSEFCGSQNCQIYGDSRNFPYILVDLPSLEKTDYLEVQGAVKSVSVPKLEVVGYKEPTELVYSQGLRINIEEGYDETLDFDAPNLHTLNGRLEVYGGVSSLSLGSLGKTDLHITLNTWVPIDVYSTIQTATFFDLWGKLNSIYLPDMDDLGSIGLAYSPKIPCNDTLYQLWLTQPSYSSDWEDINSCKNYDFPQDVGVIDQSTSTTGATTTSTTTATAAVTSVTSGSSSSTGVENSNGSATVSEAPARTNESGSNSSDSTDVSTQENGTPRAFSITSIIGAAPLIMAVVWASLY